jgi:glucan 1,3-beta-glucosidase
MLEKHWSTFVTKDELKELTTMSITHVRIPVGYWMLDIQENEPWVAGSWKHLLQGIKWCREVGLKVIIDLHGAVGSQNGFDNSGKWGKIEWPCCGGKNILRTVGVLTMIGRYFSQREFHDVVEGINLINEPLLTDLNLLRPFYEKAYNNIKTSSENPNLTITISDGFYPLDRWNKFMQPPQFENVYLDTHIYHVFDYNLLRKTDEEHIRISCDYHRPRLAISDKNLWTYVGEWSLAKTDCTKWLNGQGRGARFDGTFENTPPIGSCELEDNHERWSPEYKRWMRRFAETQMQNYETASGWFFWNFKAEKSPHWNYMLGVREGWIPRNPNERTHKC